MLFRCRVRAQGESSSRQRGGASQADGLFDSASGKPLYFENLKGKHMAEPNELQLKYKQFLDLLPLTVSLAGLPTSEPGKSFNEDQLEARAMTIKKAYRQARHIAKTCIEG